MIEIPLSALSSARAGRLLVALVDEQDAEAVQQHVWHRQGRGRYVYAKNVTCGPMHRWLLGVRDPLVYVDHINGVRLDNRRSNLRLATNSQNNANTDRRQGRSQYRGVYLNRGRWMARIKTSGVSRYLGSFDSEEEAARAWDAAAVEKWGDFVVLNIPTPAEEVK